MLEGWWIMKIALDWLGIICIKRTNESLNDLRRHRRSKFDKRNICQRKRGHIWRLDASSIGGVLSARKIWEIWGQKIQCIGLQLYHIFYWSSYQWRQVGVQWSILEPLDARIIVILLPVNMAMIIEKIMYIVNCTINDSSLENLCAITKARLVGCNSITQS